MSQFELRRHADQIGDTVKIVGIFCQLHVFFWICSRWSSCLKFLLSAVWVPVWMYIKGLVI